MVGRVAIEMPALGVDLVQRLAERLRRHAMLNAGHE